jgi:hypothetical protein
MRDRIVTWHPEEATSLSSNVPQTGKGQVRAGDPVFIPCGHSQNAQPLFGGSLRVLIERATEGWARKLQRAHQHQVAHHDQGLPPTLDNVGRVTGRMSVGREGADAWDKHPVRIETLELVGLYVGLEEIPGDLHPSRNARVVVRFSNQGSRFGRVEKPVEFALRRAHDGVRKRTLQSNSQATDVIQAAMSDINLVDQLGPIASRLQVSQNVAGSVKFRRPGVRFRLNPMPPKTDALQTGHRKSR